VTIPPGYQPSVYDEYLRARAEDQFAVFRLGPEALGQVYLTEDCVLVPASFLARLRPGEPVTWERLMTAVWEAIERMSRYGATPALGAQILAVVGGDPQRAEAGGGPAQRLTFVLTALDGFRGRNLPRHEGRAYLQLGDALADMRWTGDAMRAYERGRATLERAGDDLALRAAYVRLSILMNSVGRFEHALLLAESGLRVSQRLPVTPANPPQAPDGQVLRQERIRALTSIGFTDEARTALGTQ
jgi:hypothetical protein